MVFELGGSKRGEVLASDFRINRGRGPLPLEPHHTSYSTSLTQAEIARIKLSEDERMEVTRLQIEPDGGGTVSDFKIDIFDVDEGEVLVETENLAVAGREPLARSSSGTTILLRITNNSGSQVDATITGMTFIREA